MLRWTIQQVENKQLALEVATRLMLRFGADYNKTLTGKWSGFIDGDLFLYPGSKHGFFYESKILLIWSSNSQFRVMVGYKITYGKYPFGNHWQIVPPQLPTLPKGLPLIDIQISW